MSIFASILRSVYKLSGAKKAFALPEDALRKEIEKQNRHRGVFTPTDRKAYYETIAVNGFPCLIVREHPKPSERAILYFFGGGMVIGPDKGDLPVMRKLCRETGCDVWFPFYPLCMEHCITETYAMVYECYQTMPEADITCLDYSPDMMRQAREKADRLHLKNVTFRQGDVGALS